MSSSTSVTSTPTDIRSSSSPGVAISAYSFGFLLISVVSLFIIISCCFVRCRSGAFLGTSWDTTEQLDGRGGRRKKLVPPVLWDAWLSRPPASTKEALGAGQFEWSSIQPVYVSLIHACRSRSARQFAVAESEVLADHSTAARLLPDDSQSSSSLPLPPRRRPAFLLAHPLNFHMWPRRRSRTHHRSAASEKPTEDETENHPEAVKVAVMISMPSPAFKCWNHGGGPSCQSTSPDGMLREYQIGVAQVPWIHAPQFVDVVAHVRLKHVHLHIIRTERFPIWCRRHVRAPLEPECTRIVHYGISVSLPSRLDRSLDPFLAPYFMACGGPTFLIFNPTMTSSCTSTFHGIMGIQTGEIHCLPRIRDDVQWLAGSNSATGGARPFHGCICAWSAIHCSIESAEWSGY